MVSPDRVPSSSFGESCLRYPDLLGDLLRVANHSSHTLMLSVNCDQVGWMLRHHTGGWKCDSLTCLVALIYERFDTSLQLFSLFVHLVFELTEVRILFLVLLFEGVDTHQH